MMNWKFKIISTIIVTVLFVSTGWGQTSSEFGYIDSSFAESTKNYNNRNLILKINPLALISGDIPFYTGEYRLVAEWVTSHKTSVTIGVSYLTMSIAERILTELDTTFKNAGGSTWDYAVNGYRIQAGFRYYLKPQGLKISDPKFNPAPKGPYIFALGSYSSARSYERAYKDEYLLFTHWSVTMNFGYQILMGEKMTLDPYVGFGYKNNTVYDNKNKIPPKGLLETPEMQFIYGNHLKVNIGINLGFRF